jgi:hypothetical protein
MALEYELRRFDASSATSVVVAQIHRAVASLRDGRQSTYAAICCWR